MHRHGPEIVFHIEQQGHVYNSDSFIELKGLWSLEEGGKGEVGNESAKGGWVRSGDVILMSVGSPWRISSY